MVEIPWANKVEFHWDLMGKSHLALQRKWLQLLFILFLWPSASISFTSFPFCFPCSFQFCLEYPVSSVGQSWLTRCLSSYQLWQDLTCACLERTLRDNTALSLLVHLLDCKQLFALNLLILLRSYRENIMLISKISWYSSKVEVDYLRKWFLPKQKRSGMV